MRFFVLLLALLVLPVAGGAQTPAPDTLKVLLNPTIIFELPLMVALDKGYLAQQNLNVQVVIHAGSSQTIIRRSRAATSTSRPSRPIPDSSTSFSKASTPS